MPVLLTALCSATLYWQIFLRRLNIKVQVIKFNNRFIQSVVFLDLCIKLRKSGCNRTGYFRDREGERLRISNPLLIPESHKKAGLKRVKEN